MLRFGLLQYILYTCPHLYCNPCSKCYGVDCFSTYLEHHLYTFFWEDCLSSIILNLEHKKRCNDGKLQTNSFWKTVLFLKTRVPMQTWLSITLHTRAFWALWGLWGATLRGGFCQVVPHRFVPLWGWIQMNFIVLGVPF